MSLFFDGMGMMQNAISKSEIIHGIRNLPVLERFNLVTDIWDEIKDAQALEGISDDEKKILLNRLAKFKSNPDAAKDWSELKQEIHSRYA